MERKKYERERGEKQLDKRDGSERSIVAGSTLSSLDFPSHSFPLLFCLNPTAHVDAPFSSFFPLFYLEKGYIVILTTWIMDL
jgi:hypothetical protein